MRKGSRIKIGCDPAFRNNGFAVCICDEDREIRFIMFKKFLHFISWVQNDCPKDAIVCIENSYLQNKTFDMSGSRPLLAKKSRDVGKNQAVSEIAFQLFTEYCFKVRNMSPKQKGKKWESKEPLIKSFISSYNLKMPKKTLNQDERDAFKMLTFIL